MDSTLRSCAEHNKIGIGFSLDFQNFLCHVTITNNVFRLAPAFSVRREEVLRGGDGVRGRYMVARFLLRDHIQKKPAGLELVRKRNCMSHSILECLVRRTEYLAEMGA